MGKSESEYDTVYRNLLDDTDYTAARGNWQNGEIEIVEITNSQEYNGVDIEKVGVMYADKYITLVRDVVKFPTGLLGTYLRVLGTSGKGGVCIIPRFDNKFVLIRHFRHATRRWHVEFPRGFAESLDLADDAKRELEEELATGADGFNFLGFVFPDTGLLSTKIAVFIGDLKSEPIAQGDNGYAELVLVSESELRALVLSGGVDDAITISAFAYVLCSK